MARSDPNNRSHLWADPDIDGLLMMHADFTTHEYAPHVHDELVIAITERGGAEFRSRGLCELAEPESVLVFNPGEPHSGRMGGSDRWHYRAFYLADRALERLAADLDVPGDALPHFLTNKLQDSQLCRRFLALHGAAERRGSLLQRETELLAALGRLFIRHGEPAPALPRLGHEASAVSKVLQYLSDSYDRRIALKDLARLTEMSTFHLIRSFNKEVGLSPHAYLTQVRVHRAKALLRQQLGAVVDTWIARG